MKGNPEVISTLNQLLAEELTAINQYMVHSEMSDNWGYARLHKAPPQQNLWANSAAGSGRSPKA